MFKKILVDLHAEIELPGNKYARTVESQADALEQDARELTEFLKDHRSRDSYQINIIREYESRCEFCGYSEERDTDGTPVCCQKAIEEFNLAKAVA